MSTQTKDKVTHVPTRWAGRTIATISEEASRDNVLLKVEGLKMHFPITGGLLQRRVGTVQAVDGLDFYIKKGETLGLVGQFGCGKSTAGRAILHLISPYLGQSYLQGARHYAHQ